MNINSTLPYNSIATDLQNLQHLRDCCTQVLKESVHILRTAYGDKKTQETIIITSEELMKIKNVLNKRILEKTLEEKTSHTQSSLPASPHIPSLNSELQAKPILSSLLPKLTSSLNAYKQFGLFSANRTSKDKSSLSTSIVSENANSDKSKEGGFMVRQEVNDLPPRPNQTRI